MSFFKDIGKTFKKAGDGIVDVGEGITDGAKKVVEKTIDIGEEVVDSGKTVVEDVTNTAIKGINAAGDVIGAPDIPEIDITERESFIESKSKWVNKYIKDNAELIEQAAIVAGNLAKYKKEIKHSRKTDTPLSASIMESTGATKLLNDAEEKGFKSLSFGPEVDGSVIVGASGSAGINNSIINDKLKVRGFLSGAWSIGLSAGADGTVEVGFWKDQYDAIGGKAHGLVVGGSYYGGAALSFWWPREGTRFLGWTISPQAGFSGELEYARGQTWM